MSVRLVFLGRLSDLAGAGERDMPAPLDWRALLASLAEPLVRQVEDERIRVAINGQLLADKHSLLASEGDEVALLPPVSGG